MGTVNTPDFEALGVLAQKAQAGDGSAYECLLKNLYTYVQYVLVARLGHISELDDLTQTCLLAMHQALPTYHPSRSLKPWVNGIVRYKIADHFRALARRREFAQTEEFLEVVNYSSQEHLYGNALADQINIDALLEQLPSEWATAVRLTKLEGLSCEDAATRQGVSPAALRKRVSRAYRKLADLIEREMES